MKSIISLIKNYFYFSAEVMSLQRATNGGDGGRVSVAFIKQK